MEHQKVWLPCEQDGFTLGTIQDISSDGATVKTFKNGKILNVPYDTLYPSGENIEQEYDDNCALIYLNEGSLLNNLRIRYQKDKIYTYVANILIAINPYYDISNLYSKQMIEKYQGKSLGTLPPHLFALADKSFRDLKCLKQSQSIIVSGESGAGKTESTKYVLRYLCESWGNQSGQIEKLILDANPVLESFGNAKTVRNNNSSRFGKFIEIHFNNKCSVVGGHISHYLLEKSRIVTQSRDERNYHIFYQLIAGLDQSTLLELGLGKPDQFAYLKDGCTRFFSRDAGSVAADRASADQQSQGSLKDTIVDDLRDFRKLQEAFKDFGVTDSHKAGIFRLVAAVLHLGNIDFEEAPNDARGGCVVLASAQASLANAARLLRIEPDALRQCLLSRIMQTSKGGVKGTVYMVPLKLMECRAARDALAKALYSRLFDHIVTSVINKSLPYFESAFYVGVLDIAGFEYFQVNSFEQFCINYCNEKLQQFFNERILLEEQRIYKQECLQLKEIAFQDNSECLQLIERVPGGILHLLDEESKLPRSSPAHFTEQVHQANSSHFHLALPRKSPLKCYRNLRDDEGFIVRHFAGAVCYETAKFLDKNNDALHASLHQLMLESQDDLVIQLFDGKAHGSPISNGKLSLSSVSGKFKSQLGELMRKLGETGTHFIRCIKPNQAMVKNKFEGANVLSQLRCSGMKSVLELMHQGYPSRTSFSELYKTYEAFLPANLRKLDSRLFCRILFKAIGLQEGDYRFGLSKVFFKAGKFAEFDQLMKSDPKHLHELISRVQKYLLVARWKTAQWGALSVIKLKYKIIYRREKIIAIQSHLRACNAVANYKPLYECLLQIRQTSKMLQSLQSQMNQLKTKEEQTKANAEHTHIAERLAKFEQQVRSNTIPGFANIQERKKHKLCREYELKKQLLNTELSAIRTQVQTLVKSLGDRLTKQQELLKAQEQLEQQKRAQAEEERKRSEEATRRQKREELENRRKTEEASLKEQSVQTSPVKQFELTERMIAEDNLQRKRMEQEKLDRDLALRLANEMGGGFPMELQPNPHATEISYAAVNLNDVHISPGQELDLSKWKYSELRDIINTSCDLALLECCRKEFHRRLKVYHAWKMRNAQQQRATGRPEEQRAPDSIMQNAATIDMMQNGINGQNGVNGTNGVNGNGYSHKEPEHRYFRIPFVRPSSLTGEKGWWWAHFKGQWIARQMELHVNKQPLLLVAGVNDMQMCELSLEETRLTSKRGAEILAEEFEQEWIKQGGKPWNGS